MNLIMWSALAVIPVGVVVLAGRPEGMDWSSHRRALRALRALHRESS